MNSNHQSRPAISAIVATADDNLLLKIDYLIGGLLDSTVSLRSATSPTSELRFRKVGDGDIIAIIDVLSREQAADDIKRVTSVAEDARVILICRGDIDPLEPFASTVSAILPYDMVDLNLSSVMKMVCSGLVVIPGQILNFARSEPWLMKGDPEMERLKSLSYTESRVLLSLTEGLSNKHIAKEIDISDNTVRVHVRNIFLKLGVQNRTQAALLATRYRYRGVLQDNTGMMRKGA